MRIASTPKPWTGLINVIQRNAIRSWLRQTEPADICLYGDDYGTKEACEEFGLEHRTCELTSYGTPNIGWIFRDLGTTPGPKVYINTDIILSNDNAFKSIAALRPPFTATAARAGLIVTEEITNWDYFYAALDQYIKEVVPRCGVDIFIFTDLPPMPDFALGRGFWDKWFVSTGTTQKIPFFNLTPKFWTIHQSHNYDHLPTTNKSAWDTRGFNWEDGGGKGPETVINKTLFWKDYGGIQLKQPYVENCTGLSPRSYHMLDRRRAGTNAHRSGWPYICNVLAEGANGQVLLDDFICQSFEFNTETIVHREPWVGIFHHPTQINSPLEMDKARELRKISSPAWEESRKHLIGAIGLCDDVSNAVHAWLGVPTITIKFPVIKGEGQWTLNALRREGLKIVQLGDAHRDIRYIYHGNLPSAPWKLYRILRNNATTKKRDLLLQGTGDTNKVTELSRLKDKEYDQLLNSCVVLQHMFGAAANNIVAECIKHGTPLIVNRLPALEEYLGHDYPLFYDDEIPPHFWFASTLQVASRHLLEIKLPTVQEFRDSVDNFIEGIK